MVLFFKKELLPLLIFFALHPAVATPRSEAAKRLADAERLRVSKTQQQLAAQHDLEAAQAQKTQLADQRVHAAAAMRQIEASVIAQGDRLASAQAAKAEAATALAKRAADFAALLPLMVRMRLYPVETVLAVPEPPLQALEGLLVTRGVLSQLNRDAAALKAQEAEADRLGAAVGREAAALDEEKSRQVAAAAVLDRSVAQADAQVTQAEAHGRAAALAAAALAAQAQTLRGAIEAMDAAQAAAAAKAAQEAKLAEQQNKLPAAKAARARESALSRPKAVGQLVAPVAGPIVKAFGAPDEDGPATGITYGAASGAFVSSPCAGRVAFAAPFRSYGKLLILECGGGYDVVLAGLGQIDATPGRTVKAGEPVGRMPDSKAGAAGSQPGGKRSLYVELRASFRPVDPAPFLKSKL